MSDHEHNRSNEQFTPHGRKEYGSMPEMAKWVSNFIQRIGFPIFMCCILSYVLLIVLDRNTKAVSELRIAIVTLTERIEPYKTSK